MYCLDLDNFKAEQGHIMYVTKPGAIIDIFKYFLNVLKFPPFCYLNWPPLTKILRFY